MLSTEQQASVRAVLAFYGCRDEFWLSELTHREDPWIAAQANGARNAPITHAVIRQFFSAYPRHFRSLPESLSRGLDLIVGLPTDLVQDVICGAATEVVGLEKWFETGEGDPWRTSGS